MEKLSVLDEDWKVLTTLFPSDWQQQATELGAIERLRGFSSAEALMRTLLLHIARGYSLRETVVRAKAAGIADISDVALLKRLRGAERWLQGLCRALMQENQIVAPPLKPGLNLRIFDGTIVKEPGKTGSQWRIHFSVRLPSLECDYFKLTPSDGAGAGESFGQYPISAGDFVIGDAGYAHNHGIEYLTRAGAYVMVRVNQQMLLLHGRNNQKFALLKRLESITRAGQTREWKVLLPGAEQPIPGRLCALRKSEQAIELAHKRLRRRASKKCTTLRPETFEFAKYVMVFTTFPETDFTTLEILDWYRLRWQVELVFKRLKSLAGLGHLPKYDDDSSRAWLYGKLLVALLTQKLIRMGRDLSPWGYVLETQSAAQRLA
jgi:hypothetical protein